MRMRWREGGLTPLSMEKGKVSWLVDVWLSWVYAMQHCVVSVRAYLCVFAFRLWCNGLICFSYVFFDFYSLQTPRDG